MTCKFGSKFFAKFGKKFWFIKLSCLKPDITFDITFLILL